MATAKSTRKTSGPVTRKAQAAPAKASARPPATRERPDPARSASNTSAAVKAATGKAEKKKDKPEKIKVVRDSFTIPKTEFTQIATLKKRAMALGQEVKKSELIRAGLLLLGHQKDVALLKALAAVPTLKTGRPVKA